MKHLLFFLTLSLMFFSGTSVYAQKPCIKANGVDPTPSTVAGEPPYVYKCANRPVELELVVCSGTGIDPSQYDSRIWYDPSRYAINGPITLDAISPGIWTIVTTYTDPVFGTNTSDSAKIKIIDYPTPAAGNPDQLVITSASGTPSHCKDDIVTLHATNTNYYLPNSYRWFANTTAYDTSTAIIGNTPDISRSIGTSNYVTVIATDINGCRQRNTINAPLKQALTNLPNFGADKYKCTGQSITLKPYSPKTSGYSYYWNGATSGSSVDTLVVTAPGKYWVAVDQFPVYSCKVSDTVYVYDIPAPNFTVGGDTSLCYQASGPLHAKSSSALTYTWTPGAYFPGGNTGANPVIDFNSIPVGPYVITVTAKDGNNCSTTKTENVTHLAQGSNPYMNVAAAPLDICEGATKAFSTTATTTYPTTLTYQWTPALHLNKDTAYRPIVDLTGEALGTPFNYSLKVSDSKGCYLTITTSATLVPAVVASVGFSDSSICVGNNITLQSSGSGGTGGLTYTWSPATNLSDPAIPNPITTPTDNRLYTLTVSDAKGCQDSKTVNVKAINVIVKLIPTDTFGYSTEPMVLNPTVNSSTYTYQWSNVTTSTSLGTTKSQVADATGTYAVYATEPVSGCHATDTINVTIQVGNPRLIYVPNVVNPASSNPDNKTVKVYGTAVQEDDFTFRIYNKWGEMIYETTSFNDANTNGWNGVYKTANGTEQNLSVYTYSLHGKYFDGQEFNKTGSITLMR